MKNVARIFLIFLLVVGCSPNKELFVEQLDDGSKLVGSKQNYKSEDRSYFIVSRFNTREKKHYEYHFDRISCDTIVKKIFFAKNVTILFLSSEEKVDYPITNEDKIVFEKMKSFIELESKCFNVTIKKATGYKILYDGKR